VNKAPRVRWSEVVPLSQIRERQRDADHEFYQAQIRGIFNLTEYLIMHLDSQYGFIEKLRASPDWQALKDQFLKEAP